MLVQSELLPDVLIFAEGLVVLPTEVVLVTVKEPIFTLLWSLASGLNARALRDFDDSDFVLLTLLSESVCNVAFQSFVVDDEDDAAAEVHDRVEECLCLRLVIGSETIDNRATGKHLREYWTYHIGYLLHLIGRTFDLFLVILFYSETLVELKVMHELR